MQYADSVGMHHWLKPINIVNEIHVWQRNNLQAALTADVRKEVDLFICHHIPLNCATRDALKIRTAERAISVVSQAFRAAYKAAAVGCQNCSSRAGC